MAHEVEFNFTGKNFVVVGASSGMGRKIVLELAQSGAHVLAIARNEERLNEVKEQFPDNITISMIDVRNAEDEKWNETLKHFVERYGKINGGIYTAGITGLTPLKMYDKKLANDIITISFYGGIQFLHFVTKQKYSMENASFVLFSSIAAHEGSKGILFYAGAKAAVQAAVRSIAKEIAKRNQRINSVSPGWVETEMTDGYLKSLEMSPKDILAGPLGIGTPEDVSGMVLFLLSNRAKWITGQDFAIDGGTLFGR